MQNLAPITNEADFRRLLGLPERSIDRVESEMNGKPHLPGDLRHERQIGHVETRDARQARTAAEAMGRIPGPSESFHLAISGRFALWDFCPAAFSLAGCRIENLHVATLGFSRKNISAMADMVDAGYIGRIRLLASHYFQGTSTGIYSYGLAAFQARPDRMEFLSVRTHAKLLLMGFQDGRKMTVESSENLRSCKNIGQATLIGDPAVYDFHRGWIDGLFGGADRGPHPAA